MRTCTWPPTGSWPRSARRWRGLARSTRKHRAPGDDGWWVRTTRDRAVAELRDRRWCPMKVAVIGAGSWGTTVAALTSANASDGAVGPRPARSPSASTQQHCNADYLPEITLPDALEATASLTDACTGADVVVMGVPSHGFRAVLTDARAFIATDAAVISLSKGLEQGTVLRMTEVVAEVLPEHRPDRIGVLSGPNLASEVALGQPTASVVALGDPELAKVLAGPLHDPDVPRVHEPGRRRLRDRGRAEERDRDRRGHRARPRLRRQHQGRADHPRARRARPAGDGARRGPAHLLGARRYGRSRGDVHERQEPEPDRRRRARAGSRRWTTSSPR